MSETQNRRRLMTIVPTVIGAPVVAENKNGKTYAKARVRLKNNSERTMFTHVPAMVEMLRGASVGQTLPAVYGVFERSEIGATTFSPIGLSTPRAKAPAQASA